MEWQKMSKICLWAVLGNLFSWFDVMVFSHPAACLTETNTQFTTYDLGVVISLKRPHREAGPCSLQAR